MDPGARFLWLSLGRREGLTAAFRAAGKDKKAKRAVLLPALVEGALLAGRYKRVVRAQRKRKKAKKGKKRRRFDDGFGFSFEVGSSDEGAGETAT